VNIATRSPGVAAGGHWARGAVAVELDAQPVGVVEVERLGNAVVGGAGQRDLRLGDPLECGTEAGTAVEQQRRVEEAGRAVPRPARVWRPAQAQDRWPPGGRSQGGVFAVLLTDLEAADQRVERGTASDVGDPQGDVVDVDAGVDGGHALQYGK